MSEKQHNFGELVAFAQARDIRTVRAEDPLANLKIGGVVWRIDHFDNVVECRLVAVRQWRFGGIRSMDVEWEDYSDICGGTCWSPFEFERSRGRLFATREEAEERAARVRAWRRAEPPR